MEKNKEIKKAMVLSSGGVDSTTCLGMAVEKYGKDQVIALSISYGQKHQKEIEASRKVAEYYGLNICIWTLLLFSSTAIVRS